MLPPRLKGGAFQPAGRRGADSSRGRLPVVSSRRHGSWLDDPDDGSCRTIEIPRHGAPQPAESTYVQLRLGCFNCGVDQHMLTKENWLAKLRRVIGRGVIQEGLHLLTLCEVGGHRQGLSDCPHEDAQSLVRQVLSKYFKAISVQAYMATWQAEPEPDDDTSVTLTLVDSPKVVQLICDGEPQLVMMVFTIAHEDHPGKQGILISGQLHIRTPHQKRRKNVVPFKKKGGGPSAAVF